MIHFVFFALILSLLLGSSALLQLVSLSRRTGRRVLWLYSGVMLFLGISQFTDLITIYISLVIPEATSVLVGGAVLYHLTLGALVVLLPLFAAALVERPIPARRGIILYFIALIFPAGIVLHFITGWEFLSYTGETTALVMVACTIFRLIPRPSDRTRLSAPVLSVAVVVSYLMAVFLPLFILEILFEQALIPVGSVFRNTSVFMLIQYLTWNVINIAFIERKFVEAYTDTEVELPDSAMESYNLTPRERNIVRLIAGGIPNKVIATELSISASTVKNHIYNIYRKTGATNRVELANLIRTER